MEFYMKHFADKVYFFKNDRIIVTYKLYFLKTYFMIFDSYLSLEYFFKVDVSRFVDMTYLTEQQTDQFFSNLDKTNFRKIPHFH
jgi:hypothetical protein